MFKLILGPKQYTNNTLRHSGDFTQEILVDFEDGQECSLGFLSAMHDIISGEIIQWVLIDSNGDSLPGLQMCFKSKESAREAANSFLVQYLKRTA